MKGKHGWLVLAGMMAPGLAVGLGSAAQESRTETPKPLHTVPFELISNKPWVPVRVNGSQPRLFILDTGASGGSVLARSTAEALGLKLEREKRIRAGAGEGATILSATTRNVTFDVGGVTIQYPQIGALELSPFAAYDGRDTFGLLGHDFFRRFVVEIDYAGQALRLFDPKTYAYTGPGRALPIRFIGGLVSVRASVTLPDGKTVEGDFVVDTGARTPILLCRPFAQKVGLVGSGASDRAVTIGAGAGGESRGVITRMRNMRLGPFLINEPIAICSVDRSGVLAGSGFAGIIGGPILRRCRVVFDYARQQLILEPVAKVPAPYEYDMSGLFVITGGKTFEQRVVQSVMKGSPAAEAGMKKGDVLKTINGRPASAYTLDEIRALLRRAGTTVSIEYEREGKPHKVELTIRRIV